MHQHARRATPSCPARPRRHPRPEALVPSPLVRSPTIPEGEQHVAPGQAPLEGVLHALDELAFWSQLAALDGGCSTAQAVVVGCWSGEGEERKGEQESWPGHPDT